ncbi:MAG: tRNA lysidine(34) synthetase TilS [Candidatus Binatia bacterium]
MELERRFFELFEPVKAFLESHCREGQELLAAVSGGSDSMAMLELLALAAPPLRLGLGVACVNHGLRRGSAAEQGTVRTRAAALGLPFYPLKIDEPGRGDEQHLRELRYRLLEELADREGYDWIATGHTRDDQVETVLMQMLRGAHLRGLGGMPQRRGRVIRPLLGLERQRLRGFLESRGFEWIEDPSNLDPRYTRNRFRHRLIPEIEANIGRGSLDHLVESASRWRLDDEYLEAEARRYLDFIHGGRAGATLDLVALERVPRALRARVIMMWLSDCGGPRSLSLGQLAQVEKLVLSRDGSATMALPGLVLLREYGSLRLRPAMDNRATAYAFALSPLERCRVEGPDGAWSIEIDLAPAASEAAVSGTFDETVVLDAEALGRYELVLRPTRGAENLVQEAGRGRRSVADLFCDHKVPRRFRADWPVLIGGNRLLWVPGIALAPGLRASGRSPSSVALRWRRKDT